MAGENVELARRIVERLPLDDFAAAVRDQRGVSAIAAALEPFVDPELEIVRVGPEYTGEGVTYPGVAGFLEFWRDWLDPWQSFRIETEEFLDAGEKVVQLVRQTGRTKMSDVPVEGRGASVMTFREGKLKRIEFHLDRDVAMRSAGLEG